MAEMTPELSVLVPFYNESGNIDPLLSEIHDVLNGIPFEVICINDCSDDSTGDELAQAEHKWPDTVRVFTHVRRAGKSAALATGLRGRMRSARARCARSLSPSPYR